MLRYDILRALVLGSMIGLGMILFILGSFNLFPPSVVLVLFLALVTVASLGSCMVGIEHPEERHEYCHRNICCCKIAQSHRKAHA